MALRDKGQTIQQCRFLAEQSTSDEARCEILTSLLWFFNTEGIQVMTGADAGGLFISLTKILSTASPTVQVLSLRCIHAILPRLDSALFVINSLYKLYDTQKPLQPTCLRLLAEVSVDANVTEASKMARIAASDPRDAALVAAASYAASTLGVSIADQAEANCAAVKGPAGALLAGFVRADRLAQVSNPYGQVVLIRRLAESRDLDDQKKVRILLDHLPKQAAPARRYEGQSGAAMSFIDQMAPLEALKAILLLPYAAYARRVKVVIQAVARYLTGSVSSVGRLVGLNLAHTLLQRCSEHGYFDAAGAQPDEAVLALLGALESTVGSASQSVAARAGQVLLDFHCWTAGTPFGRAYAEAVDGPGKGASMGTVINAVVALLPSVSGALRAGAFSALAKYAKIYPQNVSTVLPTLARLLDSPNMGLRTQIFDLLVSFSEVCSENNNDRAVELSTQSLLTLFQLLDSSPSSIITKKLCDLIRSLSQESSLFKNVMCKLQGSADSSSEQAFKASNLDASTSTLLPITCLLWSRARLEPPPTRLAVIDTFCALSTSANCSSSIKTECVRILRILAGIAAAHDEYTHAYILERLKRLTKCEEKVYVDVHSILAAEERVCKGDFSAVAFVKTPPTIHIQLDSLLEDSAKSQPLQSVFLSAQKDAEKGAKARELDSLQVYRPLRDSADQVRALGILDEKDMHAVEKAVKEAEETGTLSDVLFTNGIWHSIINSSYDVRCAVSYVFLNTALHKGVLLLFSLSTSDSDLQIDRVQLSLLLKGSPVAAPADSLHAVDVSLSRPAQLRVWLSLEDLSCDDFDGLFKDCASQCALGGTLEYEIGGMTDNVKLKPFGPSAFDVVSSIVPSDASSLRSCLSESRDVLSGLFQLPDIPGKEDAAERLPSFLGLSLLESGEADDRITLLLGGQVFLKSSVLIRCQLYTEDRKTHLQMCLAGPSRESVMRLMQS